MPRSFKFLLFFLLLMFYLNKAVKYEIPTFENYEFKSSEYSTTTKEILNRTEGYAIAAENEHLFYLTSTITKDQKTIKGSTPVKTVKQQYNFLDFIMFDQLIEDFNYLVNYRY